MMTKLVFLNGTFSVDLENPDFTVRAPRDLADGDWKTAIFKGWKYLRKDEEMAIKEIFVNFDGRFLRGRNSQGKKIDIEPHKLIYVERDRIATTN